MGIVTVLATLTKIYGHRIRRFIRDVWISYLKTQQQDDVEMDRMDGTQPSSHGSDHDGLL